MERAQKKELVQQLNTELKDSAVLLIAKNNGMTVAQVTELRNRVRKSGAKYRVAKNRLAKLAVQGTDFENVVDLFKGPTAIGYAKEPVAIAKVLVEFAKQNEKFELIGGYFGNQKLDAKGIDALSKLPSLDELRGKIIGLLQAPATKIACILQAPGGQVARVINAHATKGE